MESVGRREDRKQHIGGRAGELGRGQAGAAAGQGRREASWAACTGPQRGCPSRRKAACRLRPQRRVGCTRLHQTYINCIHITQCGSTTPAPCQAPPCPQSCVQNSGTGGRGRQQQKQQQQQQQQGWRRRPAADPTAAPLQHPLCSTPSSSPCTAARRRAPLCSCGGLCLTGWPSPLPQQAGPPVETPPPPHPPPPPPVLDHHIHQPLVVLAPHHLNLAGKHVALGALHRRVQEEGLRRGEGGGSWEGKGRDVMQGGPAQAGSQCRQCRHNQAQPGNQTRLGPTALPPPSPSAPPPHTHTHLLPPVGGPRRVWRCGEGHLCGHRVLRAALELRAESGEGGKRGGGGGGRAWRDPLLPTSSLPRPARAHPHPCGHCHRPPVCQTSRRKHPLAHPPAQSC